MGYVVAYDVADDRKRDQIAGLLGRYGNPVQYSVFECHLESRQLEDVLARAAAILESPEQGCVRFYRWCADCREASQGIGDLGAEDDGPALIV